MDKASELRGRVAASPLRQFEVAKAMEPPMDRATFCNILNGHLPIPDDFEVRFNRAFQVAADEKVRVLRELQGAAA